MNQKKMKIRLIRNAGFFAKSKPTYWADRTVPLSEEGKEQARLLCNRLMQQQFKITKIYCSTYLRSFQTIEPFAKGQEIEIVQDSGFDAFNGGKFLNWSFEDIKQEIGEEVWQEIWTNPLPDKRYFEGGETLQEQSDRAWVSIQKIISESSQDDVIAVVTHETVIGCLLCRITEMPLNKIWFWGGPLKSANPSITIITLNKNRWFLEYYES